MTASDTRMVSRLVSDGYRDLAVQEGYSAAQLEGLLATCASEAAVAGWLAQWRCFVGERDGYLVGVVAVERNDIAELWVHGAHRRRGIGRALFQKAEAEISEAGFTELTVRCAAAGARPFYEAMGCYVVDTKPCAHGPLAGWPLTYYRKDWKAIRW